MTALRSGRIKLQCGCYLRFNPNEVAPRELQMAVWLSQSSLVCCTHGRQRIIEFEVSLRSDLAIDPAA